MHPEWKCSIFALCRASDCDRSKKFFKALSYLRATGSISDLDDGPEQKELSDKEVTQTISEILGRKKKFDLLITHGPRGEYTRHRRHEEVSKAVQDLWKSGKVLAKNLWLFAYEDGNGTYFPRPAEDANLKFPLPLAIWQKKYQIITEVYGFSSDSWESQTTPKVEAFWDFQYSEKVII
jgi:hypothetical protein